MQFKYVLAVVFATLASASPIVPDGCTIAEDGPVARSPSWLDARSPRVSFSQLLRHERQKADMFLATL